MAEASGFITASVTFAERRVVRMRRSIIITVVIICPVIIVLLIYGEITEGPRFAKKCYTDNQEVFDYMVDYFKKKYDGGYHIKYERDSNEICQIDNNYLSEKCEDEKINTGLTILKEKYKSYSDYDVFGVISVYYDMSGRMLMVIPVQCNRIKNASIDERCIHTRYLLYFDEDYSDNERSLIPIDYIRENENPLSGRWFFYSGNCYIG